MICLFQRADFFSFCARFERGCCAWCLWEFDWGNARSFKHWCSGVQWPGVSSETLDSMGSLAPAKLHMHKAQGFAIYQAYVTQTQIWSPSRSFVRRSQTCIRSCSIIHFRKDDGRMCNTLALAKLQRSRHNIYVSMCHHVCAPKAWRTLAHPSLKLQWRKWKSSFKARKKWRLCIVSFSRSLTLTDQWYQRDFSSIFLSFQGGYLSEEMLWRQILCCECFATTL